MKKLAASTSKKLGRQLKSELLHASNPVQSYWGVWPNGQTDRRFECFAPKVGDIEMLWGYAKLDLPVIGLYVENDTPDEVMNVCVISWKEDGSAGGFAKDGADTYLIHNGHFQGRATDKSQAVQVMGDAGLRIESIADKDYIIVAQLGSNEIFSDLDRFTQAVYSLPTKEKKNSSPDDDKTYNEERTKRHSEAERTSGRNQAVISAAKAAHNENTKGLMSCECCETSMQAKYGLKTSRIDAHHNVPFSETEGLKKLTPKDFTLLCPNCHVALHALMREMNPVHVDLKYLKNQMIRKR